MKRRKKSLEATAYHEAGHTVMAFIVRRRILGVSIIPDKRTRGHVRLTKRGDKFYEHVETVSELDLKTRAMVEAEIMFTYAGPIAEELFRGKANTRGSWGDYHSAAYRLSSSSVCSFDPEERRAYSTWLWCRAKYVLKRPQHWAAVENLAWELLQRRRIGGRTVRQIIVAAMQEWARRKILKRRGEGEKDERPALLQDALGE